VLVSRTTARRQEASMQWTPIDCFDSGLVLAELGQRFISRAVTHVPYHQFVIVAAGSQHLVVMWAPSEAADFLPVTTQVLDKARPCPHISHEDLLVFAAAGDETV